MYVNVICREYFDLVRTVEVINHTLYINGLAFVSAGFNEVAVGIIQNSGADINGLAVYFTFQSESALGGAFLVGGGVAVHDLQALHFDGSAQSHFCVALGYGFTVITGDGDVARW